MKKVLLSLAFIALWWACSNEAETTAKAQTVAQEEKAPDGKKIYKTYCVTCHGIAGDMGASGAHDLTQSTLSLEERVLVITNGRNLMTPFKNLLKEEEIQAVAEYTISLQKTE